MNAYFHRWTLRAGLLATLAFSSSALRVPKPGEGDGLFEGEFAAFAREDLEVSRAASGRPYLSFLDTASLSMGLYQLQAGGTDTQEPHALDEVYHVIEGRARFTAGARETHVEPGSILFVRAHVAHRFHDIEEDLSVLVFFSKERPDTVPQDH